MCKKGSIPDRKTNMYEDCEVGRRKELGLSGDWRVPWGGVTRGGVKGVLGHRSCGALGLLGFYWKHSGTSSKGFQLGTEI